MRVYARICDNVLFYAFMRYMLIQNKYKLCLYTFVLTLLLISILNFHFEKYASMLVFPSLYITIRESKLSTCRSQRPHIYQLRQSFYRRPTGYSHSWSGERLRSRGWLPEEPCSISKILALTASSWSAMARPGRARAIPRISRTGNV